MHAKLPRLIVFAVVLVLLEGCGGARILDEPVAMEPVAATGLILASPVLLVGGLVKAVNNDQVAKRIRERRTALPTCTLAERG